MTYLPHQQRVVDEKDALDVKRDKLTEFLKGQLFASLTESEQERLSRQLEIMGWYSGVLSERIANFPH